MDPVLVAYATKHGSTAEVARVIAETLKEQGLDTDLRPARDVRSLDGYSAVVLGAAIYAHKWHGDARRFIAHNRAALARVPVAAFALGPVNDDPKEFDDARGQLDRILARWTWLKPVSVAVFGGRFDPSGLHFPGASRMLAKVPVTDIVDPDKAAAWARTLPDALALQRPVAH